MNYFTLLLLLPLAACVGRVDNKTMAELNAEYEQKQKATANTAQSAQSNIASSSAVQTASFPSLDGLEISAKVYPAQPSATTFLLCHQARYNKSEYDGIAERLQKMGYNCMAIDQRSGGPIGAAQNETFNRATAKGLSTDYLDAEQDIRAAVQFAKTRFDGPLILWGSSYSSTLALYLGAELPEVKAVIAFSPGDYLADAKGALSPIMQSYEKPYFITSSNSEAAAIEALLPSKKGQNQVQFTPIGSGHHGSRALWVNQAGGKEYWTALENFLSRLQL